MNNIKTQNRLLFFVFLFNLLVALLFGLYFKKADFFKNSIDPSDYIAVVAMVLSLILGVIATIYSSKSLGFAQKAEEGQLYIKMMERYASKDMSDALRVLGDYWDTNKSTIEIAIKKWDTDLGAGLLPAIKIDEARHKVKYFYRDLMQLNQAGYFSDNLTRRILNTGGRYLFNNLVLPMENYRNKYNFMGEYEPFNSFYTEINAAQK